MHTLHKIFLVGALALLSGPMSAFAQAPATSTTEPNATKVIIVADVNVLAMNATTTNGTLVGSFLAKSSFGSQDGVVYGFVVRSKANGAILDTYKGEGTLTLPEGAAVSKSFSYTLPIYLPEAANVFLTLYTPTGLTLAVYKAAEVEKGKAGAACSYAEDILTCTSPTKATLSVSVRAGSPQGESVLEKGISLSANKASSVDLSSLLKDADAGAYVVSGTVIADGTVIGKIVKEYVKSGPVARIMSVSAVNKAANGKRQVEATVYTEIYNQATSSLFTLSATSPGCGEVASVPVKPGKPVAELTFSSSCDNGTLVVSLLRNGSVIDSASTSFALARAEVTQPTVSLSSYVGWAVLILGIMFVVWILLRKGLLPKTGGAPALILVMAAGFLMVPQPTHAATGVISQTVDVLFMEGGPGTYAQDAGSFIGSATITYPSSVVASSNYTVSVSQSMSGSSSKAGCRDTDVDSYACDSADLKTDLYIGGSLAVSAQHILAGSTVQTAPASGNVTLTATLNLWAPYDFGCMYTYMNPVTKCGLVYDNASNSASVTIPVTAAPTVNVYFSFLDKVKDMFTAFAATE